MSFFRDVNAFAPLPKSIPKTANKYFEIDFEESHAKKKKEYIVMN